MAVLNVEFQKYVEIDLNKWNKVTVFVFCLFLLHPLKHCLLIVMELRGNVWLLSIVHAKVLLGNSPV